MVKKSKGLSFDEKKLALSSAMKKEGHFYNLKELEVLGKKHGVIPQAIKEVVDCLVAERVVIQEKIGSLNMYVNHRTPSKSPVSRFWCFQSSNADDMTRKLDLQRTRLNDIRSEIERLSGLVSPEEVTENQVRSIGVRVSDLELKVANLSSHLNKLLKSDPATIKKLTECIGEVKSSANICTENIFILRQFLVRRFGACEEDIDKEFGIPNDFDSIYSTFLLRLLPTYHILVCRIYWTQRRCVCWHTIRMTRVSEHFGILRRLVPL